MDAPKAQFAWQVLACATAMGATLAWSTARSGEPLGSAALFAAAEHPACDPRDRVCASGRQSLAASAFELRLKQAGCTLEIAMTPGGCPAAVDALAHLNSVVDQAGRAATERPVSDGPLTAEQVDREVIRTTTALQQSSCRQHNLVCTAGRLATLVQIDQLVRSQPICPNDVTRESCLQARFVRMHQADHVSAEYVAEFIEDTGWPSRDVWGSDTEDSVWLLVQHADDQPDFQKRVLALLKDAADHGRASKQDYAYLADRVLVREGRPQEFGTQGRCSGDGKSWSPFTVRDPVAVDARRAAYGLDPMARYRAEVDKTCS